jgi:hypothetical protein
MSIPSDRYCPFPSRTNRPLSRALLSLDPPTRTFQTHNSQRFIAGYFALMRHDQSERQSSRSCRPRAAGTHPPPNKFAVFHRKFAGNSSMNVRPIQSLATRDVILTAGTARRNDSKGQCLSGHWMQNTKSVKIEAS